MRVEIVLTMRDLVEAARDLYKKRGGAIPESLSADSLQMPNEARHGIGIKNNDNGFAGWGWPDWNDRFIEIICGEPKPEKKK